MPSEHRLTSLIHSLIWLIAALAIAGVILRPWRLPEAVWAVGGAALLLLFGLISPAQAGRGVAQGGNVYLFLGGMMLLSEVARSQGLFAWVAAVAARRAGGSGQRLFWLIYVVGAVVTVFLSNDATAVVLTPAVAAATRAAKVKDPLPYLLICAFIANAASFVLPISNPANLVIFQGSMPALAAWLGRFLLPSAVSIGATFLLLRWTQRRVLPAEIATGIAVPVLPAGGAAAALGIAGTAVLLLAFSALALPLGPPTALAGVVTLAVVSARGRQNPWPTIRAISWSVLPLVAGLFVLVQGLQTTGLIGHIALLLHGLSQASPAGAAWGAGIAVTIASNLMNNLPAGLIASTAMQTADAGTAIKTAALIGVDLGPNLSVTGSLATILWLTALRREGIAISGWAFLQLGIIVTPPALFLALAAMWV